MAWYFSASTFAVRPGTLMLAISIFSTSESVGRLLDTVNLSP
jgi:hypothetical protein